MKGFLDKPIQTGATISVDPLDRSQMNLRQSVLNNRLDNRVQYARECILEDEIRNLVNVARNFEWRLDFDEAHTDNILKLVDEIIKNKNESSNWKHFVGSTLQTSAYTLWGIPGVNVLWGTAAFAAGTFLKWIGVNEVDSHLHDTFMKTRINVLDNMELNIRQKDVFSDLMREKEDENKLIIVNDWLHDTEKGIVNVEVNISEQPDSFHGLIFWKDQNNEVFLGVSIGVGLPSPGIWMFGVLLDNNQSMLSFMSFSKDSIRKVAHWMGMSSQRSYVNTSSVSILSYSTAFLIDDSLVIRFKNLGVFCKKLNGGTVEKRMRVFDYLNGH